MTTNFSGIMDSKMGNLTFNYTEHHNTEAIHSKSKFYLPGFLGTIIYSLIILICIPGIIGNGAVIQVLRCRMRRNSFTVYILNLAVADSGTLLFLFISAILHMTIGDSLIEIIEGLVFNYCTGQLLLTIISIDRCLALFFPIWYRCHQPPYLSTIVCVVTWIVSILFCGIHYTLILVKRRRNFSLFYHLFIYIAVCIPLMVVSTLALLFKGYVKSQMEKRRKLLTAILLSLFFFLIFSFPPIAIYALNVISSNKYFNLHTFGYLFACLNSSVNPLIYFLLGRRKEHRSMYNLKINLQTLFKEEEESEEKTEVPVDI
ncbi:proto-oncogene Mas-like [Pantherophis guttatus]|uniref:Proto-oncogene Mas-like n=1 Tax=Pantherophis guttatus TaxID=94885 RepID=A0A6P9DKX5_PANGU|nr:proto-oncogene Mas-like [Pantherophis guttatus]XP_060540961.1 proto-oncogene Mas-like [Pantherophis guttatus]XP_060548334.1 proto-oncogene Mas-like [Pantherophis guttatus]